MAISGADVVADHDPSTWRLRQPFGPRAVAVVLAAVVLLGVSGRRVEVDRMVALTGEWLAHVIGAAPTSQVGRGLARMGETLFPLQIAERTEVSRIEGFDPARLPWFSHVEREQVRDVKMNRQTQAETVVETHDVLVQPVGYLLRVLEKMVETLEIALWGTILAVVLSMPLAVWGARNYTPHVLVYTVSRGAVSFLRAIPEMISALFLVLAFGFGPIPGILALGLHAAGFLGKFYAEDIEGRRPRLPRGIAGHRRQSPEGPCLRRAAAGVPPVHRVHAVHPRPQRPDGDGHRHRGRGRDRPGIECQMVNQFRGSATAPPQFSRGYGLVFGHAERKAMAMALVDRALRGRELGEEPTSPAQDEEFVLSHSDSIEASGFVQHLKLPHYIDFQSELVLVRTLRAGASA